MVTIDQYAYHSRLRDESPAAKAIFSVGTLFVCIGAGSNLLSFLVFFLMTACILKSGVSLRIFVKLCSIPFWFVLIGILTIAFHLSGNPSGLIVLPIIGQYLVMTNQGAMQAVQVFLKSMAGVSCLYFLYVSTSMNQILGLFERIHTPKIVTEMMMMIYRFIFVLFAIMEQILTAQKSRLGNIGYVTSLRSAGILGASVFIKAFKHSGDILNAMESRGYDGSMDYTACLTPMRTRDKILLSFYGVILIFAALLCGWKGV